MDCPFCMIVKNKTRARGVYEDKHLFAFEDINPQAPVHILLIPKKHISTVLDVGPEEEGLVGHMLRVAGKIARDRGVSERGFRLVMNCNREAGQTVYHMHLHLLAGRAMGWPPG